MLKEIFDTLVTPEDLIAFMDQYIQYGYIDINGNRVNNLKTFKNDYRINTLEQVFESGLGICYEQAYLQKLFFDMHGIENKLYLFRIYENNEVKPENLDDIHVFTLYKLNNKWHIFEHARSNHKGIKAYNSLDDALNDTVHNLREDELLTFYEMQDCIYDVTFDEFNSIIDKLINGDIKKK